MAEAIHPAIHRAAPADAPFIAALDAQSAINPWTEANVARYCEHADFHALVGTQQRQLWGFVLYSRLVEDASLDNIVVERGHRGQGLGRALLCAALENMVQAGLERCLLEVRESNVSAMALYENNGFEVDGVRPRYYVTENGREDALLMSRRL